MLGAFFIKTWYIKNRLLFKKQLKLQTVLLSLRILRIPSLRRVVGDKRCFLNANWESQCCQRHHFPWKRETAFSTPRYLWHVYLLLFSFKILVLWPWILKKICIVRLIYLWGGGGDNNLQCGFYLKESELFRTNLKKRLKSTLMQLGWQSICMNPIQ